MRQFLGHDQPVVADHGAARGPDTLLAIGRQGEFRDSGMPSVERPLSLAVADDKDPGSGHVGLVLGSGRTQLVYSITVLVCTMTKAKSLRGSTFSSDLVSHYALVRQLVCVWAWPRRPYVSTLGIR